METLRIGRARLLPLRPEGPKGQVMSSESRSCGCLEGAGPQKTFSHLKHREERDAPLLRLLPRGPSWVARLYGKCSSPCLPFLEGKTEEGEKNIWSINRQMNKSTRIKEKID